MLVFFERELKDQTKHKLAAKDAFFLQIKSTKKDFMLTDHALFQITQYAEHFGFTALFKA